MATKLELMLEAERRGILPPEKVALLDEARKRGLLQAAESTAAEAPKDPNAGTLTNIGAGALKAASDIGSTILWPIDAAHDLIDPQQRNLSDVVAGTKPKSRHEQRKESLQQFYAENADPESLAFKGGEIAGGVAGTAGVGGALGAGGKVFGMTMPGAATALGLGRFAPALESGGFALGKDFGGNLASRAATRLAAGALTGGASAGVINPESTGTGAMLGAALPGGVGAAGAAGKIIGDIVTAPTAAGIERAAANALKQAALDPAAAAAAATSYKPAIAGVAPTLAEATLDPGLSALQRASGGKYVADAHETNRRILVDKLRELGGTDDALEAAKKAREATTGPMYRSALDGVRVEADDALNEIAGRPSMSEATARALRLGREKGLKLIEGEDIPASTEIVPGQGVPSFPGSQSYGSVSRDAPYVPSEIRENPEEFRKYLAQGLQYLKMGMDDVVQSKGGQGMAAHELEAANATRGEYIKWLEQKLPDYLAANAKYKEMSVPVAQMKLARELYRKAVPAGSDALGSVSRLTPESMARAMREGNEALAKKAQGKWGRSIEEIFTPEQLKTVQGVRDDLLQEQRAYDAAKIRGSSTGSNLGYKDMAKSGAGILGLSPKLQAVMALLEKVNPLQGRVDEQIAQALADPRRGAELLNYMPKASAAEAAEQKLARLLANPLLRGTQSALIAE